MHLGPLWGQTTDPSRARQLRDNLGVDCVLLKTLRLVRSSDDGTFAASLGSTQSPGPSRRFGSDRRRRLADGPATTGVDN